MLINSLYKFIAKRLSPAGKNAQLTVLTYHRVLLDQDILFHHEVTCASFNAQLLRLKAVFNVLPLFDAVEHLKAGTLPDRAACITFDDGYADNATNAALILQRHGLTATFFIATAYLNGGRMFNDTVIESIRRCQSSGLDLTALGLGQYDLATSDAKVSAIGQILPQIKYLPWAERETLAAHIAKLAFSGTLPDNLMMTTDQLKGLQRAGMEIGGHTARHPILAKLDADAVRREIFSGRQFLEDALGVPVRLFAYPNGKPGIDFLPEQANIVRELGFAAAVTTQSGAASQSTDPYQLPRFTPWRPDVACFIPELLINLRNSRRVIWSRREPLCLIH